MINVVLTKLTHFAQANNVLVYLVAHPTKMQKNEQGVYGVPTLYDVSGSADFRNQTHCGYTIYRTFPENKEEERTVFYNMKTKFSFQGEIGSKVEFKYCHVNGRFYVDGEPEPTYNMINDKPTEFELPKGTTAEAFKTEQDAEFDEWFSNEVEQDEIPF